ncbi:MAG: class I SAM-dependent methyltransferase [Paludibacteraceae bacterium]|nr:class I SAM-dependent methyltransferase [Paludibacteraceae bacterium]
MTTIRLKRHKEESLLRFHPWVFSGAIDAILPSPTQAIPPTQATTATWDAGGSPASAPQGAAPTAPVSSPTDPRRISDGSRVQTRTSADGRPTVDRRSTIPSQGPEEGSLVRVVAHDGTVLGVGHWQVGSIAVRILAFRTDTLPDNFWHTRIAEAYHMRERLGLIRPDNDTFRLIHGEGDFLPGLVVDVYADTAVVQAHSVGMHYARHDVAQALCDIVPQVRRVYYKSDDTLPFKAPVTGDKLGYLIGADADNDADCWATENGLLFRIDWLRGQKTGFFIDQRENRALLRRYAEGKDVLNMFCYTGGFSVYALQGGARSVTSVDVSAKAVELVEHNVRRNFGECPRHTAVAADAFDFLNAQMVHDQMVHQYDLIILDPPAFAKHRDAVPNALRGYRRLNAKALECIRPGGILFTFSCSQAVDKEAFRLAVFSAAAQVGRRVRILHQLHQPQDHPINIYHPEGEYLKGLVLYVE